jgi:hypothetical protein
MSNIRSRLDALEAGRSPHKNPCLGLAEQLRRADEFEAEFVGPHWPDRPERPVPPDSLAGRMRAQRERNAANDAARGLRP